VFFKWQLIMGTTSAIGTSPSVSLPIAAADAIELNMAATSAYFDVSSAAWYQGTTTGTGPLSLFALTTSGSYATWFGLNATTPFTFTTGDYLRIAGTYEATA
jgi:hypothetical protein